VKLVENRDAHNWTAWRDAFHPHLPELLLRAWTPVA
jgi:enterochelin esterase family protein